MKMNHMRSFVHALLLFGILLISCKPTSNETTAILLNENGYNINGQPVTYEELSAQLKKFGQQNDSDSISIQLSYGYSSDQMFELKRLLKETSITKIKEIK
jgi:biopolymer transport protein ExbD